MSRVLILADSKSYIRSNCFQSQLHESIKRNKQEIEIDYFYIHSPGLRRLFLRRRKFRQYDFALSTLRQRTLFQNLDFVQRVLGDTPFRVYDQDPWENYIDYSLTKNCYSRLEKRFNLDRIFVTSSYWRDFIELNDGISSSFVKMGMLPEFCVQGIPQHERAKSVEFRGSLHDHRKEVFSLMKEAGQQILINTEILTYPNYLNYLRKLAIFVHDESGFWICNGEQIPRSTGMWVKDIEIASQGCFSIRNYHPEGESYSIGNVSLVKFYDKPSDIVRIVDELFSMSIEEKEAIQKSSVEFIKNSNNWSLTATLMLNR